MHRVTLDSSCTEIDINDSPPKWMIIDKDNGIYDLLRVKRTLKDEWTIGEKNERVCVSHLLFGNLSLGQSCFKTTKCFFLAQKLGTLFLNLTLNLELNLPKLCVIMIRFASLARVMISELPFLLPFGAVLPSNAHFDWPYHQHWAKHPL